MWNKEDPAAGAGSTLHSLPEIFLDLAITIRTYNSVTQIISCLAMTEFLNIHIAHVHSLQLLHR